MNLHIKDRLILCALTGGIAAFIANFFIYGFNIFLPGHTINMPEATAEFFLNINPNHINIVTRILGFIWSMVVGSFYSLLYITALDLTGWDYLVIKALIVVIGGWLIGIGLIFKLLSIATYVRGEPLSILSFFIGHLVFAICLGLLTKKIGVSKDGWQ